MKKGQQGDVYFEAVNGLPKGAKKVDRLRNGRVVFAFGEATGHAHVALDENVEIYEVDGVLYARVDGATETIHEEHKPVPLDQPVYEFGQVLEYDHFAEEARRVVD